GVGIEFVPSVWVELLDHFLADRCDIAMGGVTVTGPRAEKAFFSIPIFVDGKRPLVRREDRDRFTSVAAIDQPGVRAIANPGSANEAFAHANFKRAQVTIHHDNASVFLEIVAGRADVMVTDGLEADHQAALHPELCAVPVAVARTDDEAGGHDDEGDSDEDVRHRHLVSPTLILRPEMNASRVNRLRSDFV